MSAAKMVADSTQSEFADAADGKKRKKKMKKAGKKVALPEDEDSDLDLKKDLKPISAYVKDRHLMIEEMFRSVRGASLQRALPDLLKSIALDELKLLCMEQLEVMSKKRIRRILAGEESANISSSGTEDDTSDDETQQPADGLSQQLSGGEAQVEGHPADSTSVHQDNARNLKECGTQQPFTLVKVKEEPPDSGDDGEGENEDDPAEEAQETYTSGSEDGELVKKEQGDDFQNPTIKQEPMSGSEEAGDEEEEDEEMEDVEGDQMSSMQDGTEEEVLPPIMMDQMELLELEMRARAIKAMLSSHDDGAHVDDDEEEEEYEDDDDVNDESADVDDANINDDEPSAEYT